MNFEKAFSELKSTAQPIRCIDWNELEKMWIAYPSNIHGEDVMIPGKFNEMSEHQRSMCTTVKMNKDGGVNAHWLPSVGEMLVSEWEIVKSPL